MQRGAHLMTTAANVGSGVSLRPPRHGRGKRVLLIVLGLLLVVGGIAAVKGMQIASLVAFGKKAKVAGPPPETVSSAVAESQTWNDTLDSIGSVATAHGVRISNDLSGIVSKIAFESGATARAGQTLAELDTSVERAQLAAARAKKELAQTTARRTRVLAAEGSIAPAVLDADESQLAAARADEAALAAQIERKTVRAPFAGKLGIRLVNVGQYLPSGTPITLLESNEPTYVDFALPQQDLGLVAVGMPVRPELETEKNDGAHALSPVDGKVSAVEPAVDPTTRNVKLRASIPDEATGFRPGMFANVSVILPRQAAVVAIPATAIVHASYGDSVFVLENDSSAASGGKTKTVRQQFVRLGGRRGDFVAIESGVHAGEEVVNAGAFKLRNRSRVIVNNEVELRSELSPHPPNR